MERNTSPKHTPSNHHRIRRDFFSNKRAMGKGAAIGVGTLLIIIFSLAYLGLIFPATSGRPLGFGYLFSGGTPVGGNCATTNPWSIQGRMSHYSGDTAFTSPVENRFILQGGSYIAAPDGANTAAETANYGPGTSTYTLAPNPSSGALSAGWVDQFSASGSYAQWVTVTTSSLNSPILLTTQTAAAGSQAFSTSTAIVYNLACIANSPGATAGTSFLWSESAVVPQGPPSCTAASANCLGSIQFPTSSAPTAFPTVQQTWIAQLQFATTSDNYRFGMLTVSPYGTINNPVTNYATGASGQSNAQISVQGYMLLAWNQTGIAVTGLPSSTLYPTSSNVEPSGDVLAIVPISGCGPAPASGIATATPFFCEAVPFTVQETIAALSKHAELVIYWVDMQQGAWIAAHCQLPTQAGTWPTASAAGTTGNGVPTGFTNCLVPTTGANSGNPAPLIEQSLSIILTD